MTSAEGTALTESNIIESIRVPEFAPEKMIEEDMKEAINKLTPNQD